MVSVLQEVLGAGAAGRVVVRLDGRGDKVAILDIRVDRDDGDVGCARSFKRWPHALEVDGVEEDDGDALVDEVLNLLSLLLDRERRVAREQHIAVLLDLRPDLLVDDLVERVVECHVDGAEALLVFLLLRAEVALRRTEGAEGEADDDDGHQEGDHPYFPDHGSYFLFKWG